MLHGPARRVIAHVLTGTGFGPRAQALAAVAALQDWTDCPQSLRQRLFDAVCALEPDQARPAHHQVLQERLSGDPALLAAQLAPVAAACHQDPGASWACLAALVRLWSHSAEDERPALRALLVSGLSALEARGGVSPAALVQLARTLPTEAGDDLDPAMDLLDLAGDPDILSAYRRVARHLQRSEPLPRLVSLIGGLASQRLETATDRDGALWSVCVGASACRLLAPALPGDLLATAAAQLALQYWWGARQGGETRPSERIAGSGDLAAAVAAGERALARRTARALAQDPARFWSTIWVLLERAPLDDGAFILRLGPLLRAASLRAGGAVCPDDAAAIAALLAAHSPCISPS